MELPFLENCDPDELLAKASGLIFSSARQKALAAGHSVLVSEGDTLFRLHPDGRREAIGKIDPPYRTQRGARYKLR